jgi:PKD repeat protein
LITKPNTMKKEVITSFRAFYLAVLVMLIAQNGLAQQFTFFPFQDNYLVDSLKIIPERAYEGDAIKLVAFTTHTSGGCDLINYRIWKFGSVIIVDATYEQGMLTYMCHSTDTMDIGMFPAGSYVLLFDWRETIDFNIYPNNQHCQAYFTYSYPECLTVPCANTVSFEDSSQGNVVKWKWDFGDGQTSGQQNPVHNYSIPGVYEVCLTIVTDNGCTSIYCEKVRVGPSTKCKAFFEVIYADCYSPFMEDCMSNSVAFLDKSFGDVIEWYWDFGDGQTSEEQNPVHEYENGGLYNVCLTIETWDGCTDTYCDSIFIYNIWCRADFTWRLLHCDDNFTGCERTYEFIDKSFGNIMKWSWDFGDGDTSTLQDPVHRYESDGKYEVRLTIYTWDRCYDTKVKTIIVRDTVYPGCKADFTWEEIYPLWDCNWRPTDCITPYYYVLFTDESAGEITHWRWDFGDGSISYEQNPIHEYKFSGLYEICLYIKAKGCCSDSICKTIFVGDTIQWPCEADFSTGQFTSPCPLCIGTYCVKFVDKSSWNAVQWSWDFGDGDTSSIQNPEHIYWWFPGDPLFRVCLAIKTSDNCTDTVCKIYDPLSDSLFTHINEHAVSGDIINIYPNPSGNEIFIELPPDIANKECLLSIVDMYGRKVDIKNYHMTKTSNGSLTYNVAKLNNGQYICLIVVKDKLFVGRFTVSK